MADGLRSAYRDLSERLNELLAAQARP